MTRIPIRLAEAQAPRYTSYPTAPHFGPAVDGGVYRDWLAAETPLSLYRHVPCRRDSTFRWSWRA